MPLFENAWFKWLFISSTVSLSFGIAGFFYLQEAFVQKERLERRREIEAAEREYEESFRSTMTRVYQNLRLGHFLAAYKNLVEFDAPEESNSSMYREYFEALSRIAVGLLENNFLDESEGIFKELQLQTEYEDMARDNLVKIASARRLDAARRFMEAGVQLIQEQKYIDAANELRKARLEYESVALYNLQDIREDLLKLSEHTKTAKYHVHRQDAERAVLEAKRLLGVGEFAAAQKSMASASHQIGRAAFYSSLNDAAVIKTRADLVSLKDELAFRVPNATPTFNRFHPDSMVKLQNYFYLKSADVKFDLQRPSELDFALAFDIKADEQNYFILRYKTYFFNGKMFHNGMVISEVNADPKNGKMQVQDFLPKEFQGLAIKRVDLSIYDQNNNLISRSMKAYRPPSRASQP